MPHLRDSFNHLTLLRLPAQATVYGHGKEGRFGYQVSFPITSYEQSHIHEALADSFFYSGLS